MVEAREIVTEESFKSLASQTIHDRLTAIRADIPGFAGVGLTVDDGLKPLPGHLHAYRVDIFVTPSEFRRTRHPRLESLEVRLPNGETIALPIHIVKRGAMFLESGLDGGSFRQ